MVRIRVSQEASTASRFMGAVVSHSAKWARRFMPQGGAVGIFRGGILSMSPDNRDRHFGMATRPVDTTVLPALAGPRIADGVTAPVEASMLDANDLDDFAPIPKGLWVDHGKEKSFAEVEKTEDMTGPSRIEQFHLGRIASACTRAVAALTLTVALSGALSAQTYKTYEEWQAAKPQMQKNFLVQTVGAGLLVGGLTYAYTRDMPRTKEWTKTDTALEAAYMVALIADWRQTRRAMELGSMELNPVLGTHPDLKRVDTFFALSAVQHLALSYFLPQPYRRTYQAGTLSFQVAVVRHNVQATLKLAW